MGTARIGDFDRPLTPFVVRATKAVLQAAAQQIMDRDLSPDTSHAEIEAITRSFAGKFAVARRLPIQERAAAIRALKIEKAAAVRAIRERQAADRTADRLRRQKRRSPPPESKP